MDQARFTCANSKYGNKLIKTYIQMKNETNKTKKCIKKPVKRTVTQLSLRTFKCVHKFQPISEWKAFTSAPDEGKTVSVMEYWPFNELIEKKKLHWSFCNYPQQRYPGSAHQNGVFCIRFHWTCPSQWKVNGKLVALKLFKLDLKLHSLFPREKKKTPHTRWNIYISIHWIICSSANDWTAPASSHSYMACNRNECSVVKLQMYCSSEIRRIPRNGPNSV